MPLVYCQIQGKEVKKKRCRGKEETHARKSNECVLLAEIPGARLGD